MPRKLLYKTNKNIIFESDQKKSTTVFSFSPCAQTIMVASGELLLIRQTQYETNRVIPSRPRLTITVVNYLYSKSMKRMRESQLAEA